MAGERILIVDDEAHIVDLVRMYLERDGFRVDSAADGAQGLRLIAEQRPALVILDIMLPEVNGLEVCRRVRAESDVPIVMLTARGEEMDKVLALELGADDYMVKPFSARELVARMHAILRRGHGPQRKGAMEIGEIKLDPGSRVMTKAAKVVELTPREFDLLHLLMQNAGEVVRREYIMDEVWDPHWFGPTKTLDVHVSWLRKKIEDNPSTPRYITTIRGVGFRFASEEDFNA